MPIVPSNDLSQATATGILEAAAGERVAGLGFATPNMRQADTSNLEHKAPHRIALLTLDSIQPGFDLRETTKTLGWRFFIHKSGTHAIAAATVIQKGDKYEFGGFSEGPLVTLSDQAIHFAEGRPEIRNGRFEAILLQIPELHIAALWLQNLDGRTDYFVRVPGKLMTSSEFGHDLLELARIDRRKQG